MSAFRKELWRTIVRKPGRFLALLAIVALGTGFFAGLRMTTPDMKIALDRYLDGTNAYDIRVVCTLGMTDADMDALRAVDGVDQVMPAFQTDVVATTNGVDYTMRFHSLPDAAARSFYDGASTVSCDDPSYLNRLILTEGEWPDEPGECVICATRVMDVRQAVGDLIEVQSAAGDVDDFLTTKTYRVVGLVQSPNYVAPASLGTSSLGAGIVQQYVYVPESTFRRTMPYTEAYVTAQGARGTFNGSEEYDAVVDRVKANIESIAGERAALRSENLSNMGDLRFYDDMLTYETAFDLAAYRLSHSGSQTEELGEAKWLVMGRDKNVGALSFTSDADRIDHIASVFPLIFFLVAALVALTTMTRMVDEERRLIGTYKALGYSRGSITGKYLLYAVLASGIGAAVGIAALGKLLPAVIMNAYAIMYFVPTTDFPYDPFATVLSAGAGIGITLFATWASVTATLSERPAALMLPRAPKAGKRILLERATPLWRRLSFSWKVTFRNLFRYKKRFVMTTVGIAGCTGLLLTGLGLHDAINDIIDVQYSEIVHYNTLATQKSSATDEEKEAFDDVIEWSPTVSASTRAQASTMLASGSRASGKRTDVVVPEDPVAFSSFVTLRTREGHDPIALERGSVVVNEKLARETGVGIGDVITLHEQDAMGNETDVSYDLTVTDLTENYIYNYLYLDAETYEDVFGEPPAYASVYAIVDEDKAAREELEDELQATGAVKTIAYNGDAIETYRTMLRSVDLIVVVLVVSAAALAFIVLFNLTNINIEERLREIATLKVLGFTRGETRSYIFREIALLTIIGCLVGIVFGIWLEGFVVQTAEVDQVMFGRTIHPPSYVAAFVLTFVFAAVAMAAMAPKLARIDMVESLKSNE